MATSAIWISYDLGVRGDYASLYAWLDTRGAKECGDSVAFLNYEHKASVKEQLKIDLKKALTVDNRTRVYVIYREAQTNKNKGAFIFGGRRAPPWTGYASKGTAVADDDEL